MPISGETAYSVRVTVPDVLQSGRDNVVALEVQHAGETVHPSSGTLTLFAQGATAVISAAATTFHAGRVQYTIPAAALDTTADGVEYGDGWLEEWALTISGTVYTWTRPAALAKRPISPSVTDTDLLAEYPDLANYWGSGRTNAQTFIDSAWHDITRRWLREGGAWWPVASPYVFFEAHRELTLSKLWRYIGKSDGNEVFVDLSEKHQREYARQFETIATQYDRDQDGRVDDPDRLEARHGVVHVNTPTAYSPRRGGGLRGRRYLIR
jgi:hypothetical protein